jgi:hypothetical protein
MHKYFISASLCLAFAALTGCTASEADCDKFGEKFVELSITEGKAQGLPEELMKTAAEGQKAEVVKTCKAEPPLKSEIDCALKAATLAELEKC